MVQLIFLGIVAVFVLMFATSTVKVVQQSRVLIIERLGKFDRLGKAGLNILVPFVESVHQAIDLRTQVTRSKPQKVITKDNVTIEIDTVIYYQVTDPFKATYEVANLVQAIDYLSITALRDVIGALELDDTLSGRDQINEKLREALDAATNNWGVRVERVEVVGIEPPADIKQAMESQMRAERERRALILQAQGEKEAAIAQAEGKKQSAILNAEAGKQSAILAAEGEKQVRLLQAEAEAQAIERLAAANAARVRLEYDALRAAGLDEKILTLKSIENFGKLAESQNKLIVPYETGAFIGSLAAMTKVLGEKHPDEKEAAR